MAIPRIVDQLLDANESARIERSWRELSDDERGTLASIRACGDAGRFFCVAGPLLAFMVRRSIARDLATLRARLEAAGD